MAGYFGTEAQQRSQALAEANVAFINETPGACQNVRMMVATIPTGSGGTQSAGSSTATASAASASFRWARSRR